MGGKGKRRRRDDGDGGAGLRTLRRISGRAGAINGQRVAASRYPSSVARCAIVRYRDSVSGEVQLQVVFSFVVLPD